MPKPRQPLNPLQTEVLLILYKFRFATRDLIVSYQELPSRSYTQVRLVNLLEQGYIGRHYSGRDKLAGKPARYYLEAKGIRFLLAQTRLDEFGLNPKVLNLIYKDKQAKQQSIERGLDVFRVYEVFTRLYGNDVDFYTKSEIAEYDYFLKPLPDAFINFSGKHNDKPDYILELVYKDTPYFAVRRRINQYFKQYASGEWQKKTDTDYPALLLITETPDLERRTQKTASFRLNDDETLRGLKVYTSTMDAIQSLLEYSALSSSGSD